jgi:hypothetical protein
VGVGGWVGIVNNRDMLSFTFAFFTLVERVRVFVRVCLTAFA